jgi:hypothetical protein
MKIMKLKAVGIVTILLAFGLHGQEAKVTVHVTDEGGVAVSNAEAVAQFQNALKPGEGQGTGRPTEVRGLTDTNGLCVLTGNGTDGSVGIGILKDGYYYGNAEVSFTNGDHILNRWLPWNPTVEVIIQKKGVQVPMYARKVNEVKIPTENQSVGFDLMVGDWVAPYGKGETSDFLFKFESKPEPEVPPREIRPFDVTLTLSFSNDGDGIQSVFVPQRVHTGLRLPRQAPAGGYEPKLTKHQQTERGQVPHIEFRDDQNYFFRVRTKKDAQGNIVSALYGKIDGDFNQESGGIVARGWLSFTYYLNPEPNSRNMEFDPKQNLFKNLPPLERVTAP